MSRILVIEDNDNIAFGLRNNLEIEGYEVEVTGTGEAGLVSAGHHPPDLVILDLMLPGMDGLRVLRALRAESSAIPVLVLTARGEEADKVRALKLGADDYVTKPFGVLELLARVEAMLRRSAGWAMASPAVAPEGTGDIEIDLATRTVRVRDAAVQLSPKEFDLLVALSRRRGAVVSRLDLLREVWGYGSAVMSRTVDTHMASLRRKVERDPAHPAHLLTVRKIGYRLAR
jgi:DNA-binding response OmpR family regulator